jgi:hypothetical protein
MFEKHKAKEAEKHYEKQLAEWQQLHDSTGHLLQLAQSFNGDATASGLLLKPSEALFATVTNVGLVEDRRGAGHWEGHSSGVSIPIGSLGGHSVRYRVGASRGHYVQGNPVATAVDTGTVFITNQRVVFQGARQTRECLFSKLVGYQHEPDGSTVFSVSNRQKPTVVHYGTKIASWFDFRVELALAHYRGTVAQLVDQLGSQLAQIEQSKPVAPAPAT